MVSHYSVMGLPTRASARGAPVTYAGIFLARSPHRLGSGRLEENISPAKPSEARFSETG